MLQSLQNIILRMVAQGDELQATLERLCVEVEYLLPGAVASILTLDDQGRLHPCVGPSLPMSYSIALDNLEIGPAVGSCGSAAFLGEAVIVDDIEHDPRWAEFKTLALPHSLRACYSNPIFGSKGKILGTFALYFRDARAPSILEQTIVESCLPLCMIAMERHERLREYRRLAFTDVLTGLPNRAKFNVAMDEMLPGDWALLLVDVDNLKVVNDTFGHAAGDDLIASAARGLLSVVSPRAVYRLGGDEFAIVLEPASGTEAENIAAEFARKVHQPTLCAGHTVFPSITVGIAHSEQRYSAEEVRHFADLALYHAKDKARGGFVTYDAALTSTIAQRYEVVQSVATALRDDRFEAWYQPIVRIDTGEIVGVEALARMRLVTGEVLPAAAFHEATKDAHVAASLTRTMIKHISMDLGSWLRSGIPIQHVGINLSAADFQCEDFPESLQAAFAREGVPLHHAILEVTESVYLGGRDQIVAKKIASMRAAGFKIALDDFGTGFASLTHLITIPVDLIKIDKSFTDRLGDDDVGVAIVEGILHIAKRMGVPVVAEGVETPAQAEMLLTRGCTLGQGYLYAKAMPASEMGVLLRARGQKTDKVAARVNVGGAPGRSLLIQKGKARRVDASNF
ncbi:EAL domain-containing protein [Rhizobium sp. S96]|uniref:sensor domain-containing phosphodiesterase n=1 Tax=Rhizobium sp. S96 TaxID=3055140 RepID=UPI0025AAA259|nr:EAL domain-containing protein [Rhizobium sp. S96]MDM9621987.1 EAL domain-containing protein [Rhizobium sp. S96]